MYGRSLVAAFSAVLLAAGLTVALTQTSSAAPTAYGIWSDSTTPKSAAAADTKAVELGVQFTATKSGTVQAIRYYKFQAATGSNNGTLWSSTGQVLGKATFSSTTGTGWKTATFSKPVSIQAGTVYVASYTAPTGRYAADANSLGASARVTNQDLTAVAGVYDYGLGLPTKTWQSTNYYADVLFTPSTTQAAATSASTRTSAPTSTRTTTPTSTSPRTTAPTTTRATTSASTSTTTPRSTTATTPANGTTGCASKPSSCGYPDATNTGVPSGKTLISVPGQATSGTGWHYDSRGWIAVDGDGAVLDGISTTASIDVTASNVTIKNSRIVVSGETWGIALRHAKNVTIQSSEIAGPAQLGSKRLMVGIKDIYSDSTGLRILGNDIWNTGTGVQVDCGLIQDNFIHDLGYTSGDHVNGTTSNGGSTQLVIRHNTVFNPHSQTDAISLFQDFSAQSNRIIDNNLMAGGGYTLYAGANPGKESTATNISVTNNRFSRMYYPNGGSYGPATAYRSGGGNVWSGNIWDDSGAPVNP